MTNLIETSLARLATRLPGRVSNPGEADYAAAVAIWPKSGASPRAVVHCRNADDVQLAVRAAQDAGMPLSVRGGGHDWEGRSLCDGLVIDLRLMKTVTVDAEQRLARIGGGARAAAAAAAAASFDLAPVTGSVGDVGMTGLTLGGGYGPLIGRCGLALDNLISAEVVLADGRLVVASQGSEPDLYWALRGGGGNFGVVTAMRCRLHPLDGVWSGLVGYAFAEARRVLEGCAEIAASAPDALSFQVALAFGEDGAPTVLVIPTWCGAPDEGEARLAPFLKLGAALFSNLAAMPYPAALTFFDAQLATGRRTFMETCNVPALDPASIDAMIRSVEDAPSPGCAIFTHEFKGAATRVAETATAFGLRREHVLIEILAAGGDRPDELEERRAKQWARKALDAFAPTALAGAYPNLMASADPRAAASYGANGPRLAEVKRRYDPHNVFRSAIPLPAASDERVRVG